MPRSFRLRLALALVVLCACNASVHSRPLRKPAKPVASREPIREGRFLTFRGVEGHGLRARDIRVLLPLEYDESEQTYPVLLVLDGQNAWEGGFDVGRTVDALTAAHEIQAQVVIAIPSSQDRVREFTPWNPDHCTRGDDACSAQHHDITVLATRDFILEDVVQRVAETVRLRRGRSDTTLVGFSYGGLAAVYLMMRAADQIGQFVISSPSVWWGSRVAIDDLSNDAGTLPNLVSLDVAENESDDAVSSASMHREVEALADALARRGLVPEQTLRHHSYAAGNHSPAGVALRLADALRFVIPIPSRHHETFGS